MYAPRKTLIDYLIIAVCPILIGLLVGSLAFFILECTHAGRHDLRVRWIVTCFVVAIVGISRISIEMDEVRAGAYGIALASVTLLAMTAIFTMSFVPFVAMCAIVALTWWASHKLTWNCTFIDDEQEDVGRGLLEPEERDESEESNESEEGSKKAHRGWSFLKSLFFEPEDRRHAPGVWIIYFAVVAIPVFTLGQWMIPASDADAGRAATRYVGVYLLSTLGLLVATSLLGLRRYLRRRGAAMPGDITAAWLVLGGVLILLCAWLAAFLPRPGMQQSELLASVRRYLTERQPTHSASRFAFGDDGAEENPNDYAGSGRGEEDQPGGESEKQPEGGGAGGGSDQRGHDDGGGDDDSQSGDGGKQGGGNSSGESEERQDAQGEGSGESQSGGKAKGKKGGEGSGGQKSSNQKSSGSGGQKSGGQKSGDRKSEGRKSDGSRSDDSRSKTKSERSRKGRESRKESGGESNERDSQDDSQDRPEDEPQEDSEQNRRGFKPPSSPQTPRPNFPSITFSGIFGALATIVRWIAFLVVLGLVAYWAFKHRRELIQAIREILESLRALWESLWGFGGKKEKAAKKEEIKAPTAPPRKRFADLFNPFAGGRAGRMDSRALVQATFEAIETWAADFGIERREEETPRQFLIRMESNDILPRESLSMLNETYSRTTYDALEESAETKRALQSRLGELWQAMSQRAATYSSASANSSSV